MSKEPNQNLAIRGLVDHVEQGWINAEKGRAQYHETMAEAMTNAWVRECEYHRQCVEAVQTDEDKQFHIKGMTEAIAMEAKFRARAAELKSLLIELEEKKEKK